MVSFEINPKKNTEPQKRIHPVDVLLVCLKKPKHEFQILGQTHLPDLGCASRRGRGLVVTVAFLPDQSIALIPVQTWGIFNLAGAWKAANLPVCSLLRGKKKKKVSPKISPSHVQFSDMPGSLLLLCLAKGAFAKQILFKRLTL